MLVRLVENITQLCETRNLTFAELERNVGLSNNSIRRWVSNCPSIDKLVKVADYFNISLDCLVGRNINLDVEMLEYKDNFKYLNVVTFAKNSNISPEKLLLIAEFISKIS
ncbi:MAG: helix-turn-helix family protein [Clostridiaceae bacterium]|jgi:transcriptional regulator with XRE-family HTH domain|nr:helix-turn-helix family protein [Clostridiaceae bacterium]